MRRMLALLSLFVFAHCRCVPVGPAPGRATCESACAHLAELGCEAGRPTARGHSCQSVCEDAAATGWGGWDVQCVVDAVDCASADVCE